LNLKKGILAFFAFITTIVGWAMWMEPHLDFEILTYLLIHETFRLISDPFAFFGLILMLLGIWLLFMLSGPWTLTSIQEVFEYVQGKEKGNLDLQKNA
jgi:hypothetical protein